MKEINVLFRYIENHEMIMYVCLVIVFDLFTGVMRAIKERKANSSIGIDGMIRKVSMIGCLLFLVVLDFLLKANLISWLPETILNIFKTIGIDTVGVSDIFALLFTLFELLSVLKNWALLELPMFKGIDDWILNFLETFTDELPASEDKKEDETK